MTSSGDQLDVDLLDRAEAAVRLSATDPRLALGEARAVLDLATGAYGEAASVALRAAALAARELGDLELAGERLEEAIAAGRGFPRRVAQARMSLVTVRAQLGDPEGGLRLADLAERDLAGADLARLGVQRSVALILLGRHEEAIRHCDRAIGLLDDDPRFRAGGLLNRGLAHTYLDQYGEAEADLAECARVARSAGLDHVAMLAEGNLPFVAARRGDIAAAFARYRAAEATLFGFPERLAVMRTDFAEALVAARLPGEARTLLEQAVPELVAAGAQAALPGARLLLAQAALLAGDAPLAETTARTALAELDAQGRTAWLPLAREVVLRARLAETPAPPAAHARDAAAEAQAGGSRNAAGAESLVTDLVACADDLAACGWPGASAALRLTAAAAAVRLGAITTARPQLDRVAATATRPLVRWHAVAIRHRLDGDLDRALAATARGIEAVHAPGGDAGPRDRDVAWDAELRVHAARPAEDLAAFGLEIALDRARRTGDARTVLEWAERWRAVVRGAAAPTSVLHCVLPAGAGLLVELVRRGDDLFAVTAGSEGCALRALGSYQAAVEATVRIRYGLRRRALLDTLLDTLRDAPSDAGDLPGVVDEGTARELSALDRALLSGPGTLTSAGSRPGGPVTVVPTGALCTLPWPLLPSLRGRPVSVAADAAAWLAPRPGPAGVPLVLSLAGPGLDHAAAEADMVATAHARARRVGATRAEALRALERADVLHVAAHGMFSPRGPMLSQITLDDGPLMAYDLLTARRIPRLVVLSACDAGMAHAPVDGAALGLAGAFLDSAARNGDAACVVAGVVPVRDDEALTLMTLFHTLLAEGRSPAEALAQASEKTAVPGFVCFGAGDEPLVAR
ncbi:CHAT domain-containing tetratricopeptide repeat protein [Microbispora sp. NBRC 16548]|uniref:CHAT domain-containing protein n=1 Tax=Microbispora sp. NBRC 16548 TaxID=3030994 RepID=UPI002553B234|nr:CHAT domain-containing tetratricopeptide repeat protein [Microbispora sp. NBRC 16548]